MKDGPDIARIAALIGDPARASMLVALMSGKALTATELAAQAGVTVQTASSHLAQLHEGGCCTRASRAGTSISCSPRAKWRACSRASWGSRPAPGTCAAGPVQASRQVAREWAGG